jgi:hypothetical protein
MIAPLTVTQLLKAGPAALWLTAAASALLLAAVQPLVRRRVSG